MNAMLPDDDARIEEELPERPIATLRDIQFLYGSLNILSKGVSGEYAAYLTPTDADDILGNPDSVIAVRIDVSGDSPQYEGVHIETYRESLKSHLAHARYPTRGSGIDHSITHISGADTSPDKLGKYAADRLTRWPTEDAITELTETHSDGELIRSLAELGKDSDVVQSIKDGVFTQLNEDKKAFLTVQIRRSSSEGWLWPGEIGVFQDAMVAQQVAKMATKNKVTSKGTAHDMVTGDMDTSVGAAEDPLECYATKQAGTFPNINATESWRTHAISPDTALRVSQAKPYLKRCATEAYRATVYTLPYFTEVDAHRARLLQELFTTLDSEDVDKAPLQYIYEHAQDAGVEDELRFAVVALVESATSPPILLGHTMNNAGFVPADVAATHEHALESPLFSGSAAPLDWFDNENDDGYATYPLAFPWHTSSAMGSESLFGAIARGYYFDTSKFRKGTFARRDDTEDPSPNDASIRAFLASFGGDPFPVSELFSEYTQRLIEEEDPGSYFPRPIITQQFTQYLVLAECGLLSGNDDLTSASLETMTNTLTEPDPDASTAEHRAHALNQFIEGHPPLENSERRAIFLLGALIGHVDRYQRTSEDRSQTVLSMHPINSITKASLKRTLSDVLHKTTVYSQTSDHVSGGLMYSEITSRLPEEFESGNPTDWDISLDDLRYHYALGVAYAQGSGRNNNNN